MFSLGSYPLGLPLFIILLFSTHFFISLIKTAFSLSSVVTSNVVSTTQHDLPVHKLLGISNNHQLYLGTANEEYDLFH